MNGAPGRKNAAAESGSFFDYAVAMLFSVLPDLRSKVYGTYALTTLGVLAALFDVWQNFGTEWVLACAIGFLVVIGLSWHMHARQNWRQFREGSRWLD